MTYPPGTLENAVKAQKLFCRSSLLLADFAVR